jgi:hypothetical protein
MSNDFLVVLDRLVSMSWEVEEEDREDLPEPATFKRAWNLLLGAHEKMGPLFPRASVSTFDRTIRVEWGKPGTRSVRLIVESKAGKSYLYHEGDNESACDYDVSVENLINWLYWFRKEDASV